MNTEYIECIEDIVIKNPYGCSMMSDVEMIETYNTFSTTLKQPPSSRFIKSETVTIKGYLNDGAKFSIKLPIDIKKQIEIIVNREEHTYKESEERGEYSNDK